MASSSPNDLRTVAVNRDWTSGSTYDRMTDQSPASQIVMRQKMI